MLGSLVDTRHRSFTLVELLIVVVVLGIVAATVIPAYLDMSRKAEQTTFITDVRILADAATVCMIRTGKYPEGSPAEKSARGWKEFGEVRNWSQQTPIGGVWSTDVQEYGYKAGIGVHFRHNAGPVRDDFYMYQIDLAFDDGKLGTGRFRQLDKAKYFYILAE